MSTEYGTDKSHWRDTAAAASETLKRLGRKSALLSGIIAIAFLIIATLIAFSWRSDLPSRIPVHWNSLGEPTRFTSFYGMIIEWFVIVLPTILLCSLLCWKMSTSVMMRRFGVAMNLWMGTFCASMMLAALWFQRGTHPVTSLPASRVAIPNIIAIAAFAIGWFLTPGDPPLPTSSPVMPDASRSAIGKDQRAVWLRRITVRMGWLPALGYVAALAFTLAMGYFLDIFALMLFLVIAMVIAAIACFAFVIKIDSTGLTVRSILGWPRTRVPSNEILEAQVTEVNPFGDFGGYGWRGGFNGSQVGIITRAGEALLINRTGNREFVVTTDDPQTAAELLNTFADRSRNLTRIDE